MTMRNSLMIDGHVGARLRLRRTLLGIALEDFARRLNLSYQKVQNFENGIDRVSASKLAEISYLLDVPVSYFFDGLGVLFGSGEAHREEPSIRNAIQEPCSLDVNSACLQRHHILRALSRRHIQRCSTGT